MTLLRSLAVIQFDPVMEQRRVSSLLSSNHHSTNSIESSFWADRDRGHLLALLQVRAQHLESFFTSCKDSLFTVYEAMYPLDARPERLYHLVRKLSDRASVESCITAMRVAGAEAALAMIRMYLPGVNLRSLFDPIPPSPGGGDWQMGPIYQEVHDLAVLITDRFTYEDARLRSFRVVERSAV